MAHFHFKCNNLALLQTLKNFKKAFNFFQAWKISS
jgi:hypothetical protein